MTDDRAAVLDVVRRYVEGPTRGEDTSVLVDSGLRVREEERHLEWLRSPMPGHRAEIHELEVERIEDDGAVVRLGAIRAWRDPPTNGGRPLETAVRITGPVRLRRRETGWLIEDIVVDGRPLLGSLYAPDGAGEIRAGSVRIGAYAGLADGGCIVGAVVENEGSQPVQCRAAVSSLQGIWREHPTPDDWIGEVPPGERRGNSVVYDKRVPLRVGVTVEAGPETHRFLFGPPADVPFRLRWQEWRPWVLQGGLAVVMLAALAYGAGLTGVGLGLVALGLLEVWRIRRYPEWARPTVGHQVVAYAAAPVGLVLVVIGLILEPGSGGSLVLIGLVGVPVLVVLALVRRSGRLRRS